jgi:hypothetical protein
MVAALACRRSLNPQLRRWVRQSGVNTKHLAHVAGFVHMENLYGLLRAESVPLTDATLTHLHRIADAVGFPRYAIFRDEGQR